MSEPIPAGSTPGWVPSSSQDNMWIFGVQHLAQGYLVSDLRMTWHLPLLTKHPPKFCFGLLRGLNWEPSASHVSARCIYSKMVPKLGPKGPITDLMAVGTCQGLTAHWVQWWGRGSVDMAELTQAVLWYYCHRNPNKWKKVDVNDFSSGGDEQ